MRCYRPALLGVLALVCACSTSEQKPPRSETSKLISRPGSQKVIVFIPGVFGSLEGTWRNEAANTFWPELMIDDAELQGFDAYLLAYESPLLWRAMTIQEISSKLYQRLWDENIFTKYNEVYFVAHSMGGLITQRILASLNTFDNERTLRRVKGVLLFSTPSNGATIAELGSYISLNPQLTDMKPATLNSWIQSVQDDIVRLRTGRDSTSAWYPRMFAAYETQPLHGKRVVPRVYASFPGDLPLHPFEKNHATIVKPGGPTDDVHIWAKARIRQAMSPLPSPENRSNLTAAETPAPNARRPAAPPVQKAASCVYHKLGNDSALKWLAHEEGRAVVANDIARLDAIFASDAKVRDVGHNGGWMAALERYAEMFRREHWFRATHFRLESIEIRGDSGWMSSGSSISFQLRGKNDTSSFTNPAGSEQWHFTKDPQGCWKIYRFAYNIPMDPRGGS